MYKAHSKLPIIVCLLISVFIFIYISFPVHADEPTEGGSYEISGQHTIIFESKKASGQSYSVESDGQGPEYDLGGDTTTPTGGVSTGSDGDTSSVPTSDIPSEPAAEDAEADEDVVGAEAEEIPEEEEEEEEKEEEEELEEELEEQEMEEKLEEEGISEEPKESMEGPAEEAYEFVVSPTGEIKYISKKTKTKTIVTVLEGKVYVFYIDETALSQDGFIKEKLLIAILKEMVEPYKIVRIFINKKLSLAYIPSPKISSKLEKIDNWSNLPVIVKHLLKPEYNAEYKVIGLGKAATTGHVYSEGKLTILDKKEKNSLLNAAATLKSSMVEYNNQVVANATVNELKEIAPKKYHNLLEEKKAESKLIKIAKKNLKIIFILLALAAIALVIFLVFKKLF